MAVFPPVAVVCPPGLCVFGEDFKAATLVERTQLTHDTIMATFDFGDESKPLGLSTCACILAKFNEEGSPDPIVRPYTPVSTNRLLGKFQLVIKVYEMGKMSQHIQKLPIGGTLEFKHISKNVKVQYPFGKKFLTMLVGGTGITPMVQALHAILGTATDETQVTMVYGNKAQKDILLKELLDKWSADYPTRLKVVHVLSDAADDSTWTGPKGFITKELLAEQCPPASEDHMVMVCGPPPMYTALCGPRDKPEELTGALSEMGFTASQVFKF